MTYSHVWVYHNLSAVGAIPCFSHFPSLSLVWSLSLLDFVSSIHCEQTQKNAEEEFRLRKVVGALYSTLSLGLCGLTYPTSEAGMDERSHMGSHNSWSSLAACSLWYLEIWNLKSQSPLSNTILLVFRNALLTWMFTSSAWSKAPQNIVVNSNLCKCIARVSFIFLIRPLCQRNLSIWGGMAWHLMTLLIRSALSSLWPAKNCMRLIDQWAFPTSLYILILRASQSFGSRFSLVWSIFQRA